MKYTLRNLLATVTVAGIMAATIRIGSPVSVLVMLTCVVGLLGWAAVAAFRSTGLYRRVYGIGAAAGVGYLLCYVFTNSPVEAWINAVATTWFLAMEDQPAANLAPEELRRLLISNSLQIFQQKVHLLLALLTAGVAAWIANT